MVGPTTGTSVGRIVELKRAYPWRSGAESILPRRPQLAELANCRNYQIRARGVRSRCDITHAIIVNLL